MDDKLVEIRVHALIYLSKLKGFPELDLTQEKCELCSQPAEYIVCATPVKEIGLDMTNIRSPYQNLYIELQRQFGGNFFLSVCESCADAYSTGTF